MLDPGPTDSEDGAGSGVGSADNNRLCWSTFSQHLTAKLVYSTLHSLMIKFIGVTQPHSFEAVMDSQEEDEGF